MNACRILVLEALGKLSVGRWRDNTDPRKWVAKYEDRWNEFGIRDLRFSEGYC
jgi:hypothetical protein